MTTIYYNKIKTMSTHFVKFFFLVKLFCYRLIFFT
nr:MAG TPA: hypothetical protein [Caudoviricetes sp.]